MSVLSDLVQALVDSGASAEQISAAVAVFERDRETKEQARLEKQRERVRRHRERNAVKRSVTLQDVSEDYTPQSPPLPPTPPNTPPIPPSSEANASGAAAPNVVPFSDPRADLFGRGIQAVMAMTGKARPQAATMVGHWLKIVNDEALLVLRVIDEAVDHRPANPTAWIEAALRRRKTDPPPDARKKRELFV